MPPVKGQKWGNESEFMRKLRDGQLDQPMLASCEVCGIKGKRVPARDGIKWFKEHAASAKHKAALRRRDAAAS